MPVRIYDISKKLGLENKEVLSKAKELGITAARVASSSLDKITAEYLEQQLIQAFPNLAAPAAPTPPPAPQAAPEPIRVVSAPPPAPEAQVVQTETATATALLEPPEAAPAESIMQVPPAPDFEAPPSPAPESQVAAKEPTPPAIPAGPKVGDKVGFIQLPPKPGGNKPADKAPPVKLPQRPVEPRRTDFNKRGDIR